MRAEGRYEAALDLLRLEMVGRQAPSNLPSRKAYRDDYYALIFCVRLNDENNGHKYWMTKISRNSSELTKITYNSSDDEKYACHSSIAYNRI